MFVLELMGHMLKTRGPFGRLSFVSRDYVAIYLIILVLFNTFYSGRDKDNILAFMRD